jgi:hypothetical protein
MVSQPEDRAPPSPTRSRRRDPGLPNRPHAVYAAFSRRGLLYLGITGIAMRRFDTHTHGSLWWPEVDHIQIIHVPDRRIALAVEAYLISYFDPPGNAQYGDTSLLHEGHDWLVAKGLWPGANQYRPHEVLDTSVDLRRRISNADLAAVLAAAGRKRDSWDWEEREAHQRLSQACRADGPGYCDLIDP